MNSVVRYLIEHSPGSPIKLYFIFFSSILFFAGKLNPVVEIVVSREGVVLEGVEHWNYCAFIWISRTSCKHYSDSHSDSDGDRDVDDGDGEKTYYFVSPRSHSRISSARGGIAHSGSFSVACLFCTRHRTALGTIE